MGVNAKDILQVVELQQAFINVMRSNRTAERVIKNTDSTNHGSI